MFVVAKIIAAVCCCFRRKKHTYSTLVKLMMSPFLFEDSFLREKKIIVESLLFLGCF